MAEPNLGFLEILNNVLPYVGMAVVAIVAIIGFVYYTKKYTPEIARTFIKAYHKKGLPLFLQDEMGNVSLSICDKKFPEGVIHVKDKGWFLLPNPPAGDANNTGDIQDNAPKRGRPSKEQHRTAEQLAVMSETERNEYIKAYGILVQSPILKGFGKQVFFGSTVTAAVSNLTAIAHSDLLAVRNLSPMMYQKTQLDALATGSRWEGFRMGDKDVKQLFMYAIVAAVIIVAVCAGVYLVLQSGAPPV